MAESVRLLASLAIDGRALHCEHAVLLLAEPRPDDWLSVIEGNPSVSPIAALPRLQTRRAQCCTAPWT
jgi:hypothetical protein